MHSAFDLNNTIESPNRFYVNGSIESGGFYVKSIGNLIISNHFDIEKTFILYYNQAMFQEVAFNSYLARCTYKRGVALIKSIFKQKSYLFKSNFDEIVAKLSAVISI